MRPLALDPDERFLRSYPIGTPSPSSTPRPLPQALPYELLEAEICALLSFPTAARLGSTCLRLSRSWKLYTKTIPPPSSQRPYYQATVTDEGVLAFPNLTSLDISYIPPWHKAIFTGSTLVSLKHLRSLHISENQIITDLQLSVLTNLTELTLGWKVSEISEEGILPLTNLRSLSLGRFSNAITDRAIRTFTRLTALDISEQISAREGITNASVSLLTNLTDLNLGNNAKITGDSAHLLTNLTRLNLRNNQMIGSGTLVHLTRLRTLELKADWKILPSALTALTCLTYLDLSYNIRITDDALLPLTNLRTLLLAGNKKITDKALSQLTYLEELSLASNSTITSAGVSTLENLTSLDLSECPNVKDDGLMWLTNLTSLKLKGNKVVSNGVILRWLKKLDRLSVEGRDLLELPDDDTLW